MPVAGKHNRLAAIASLFWQVEDVFLEHGTWHCSKQIMCIGMHKTFRK
jgi:hypothetical protein